MEMVIILSKEDIQTGKCGDHTEINTGKGITINFAPDALQEFLNDIGAEMKELPAEVKLEARKMEVLTAISTHNAQLSILADELREINGKQQL